MSPATGASLLGHKASRGVAVTMGGLWSKTLIQMASTVVLARLLEPGDFGLIAMVMAIVGLADLLRDFGLTGAILQARDLTTRQWSSLLWLSAGLGSVLMLIIAAASPLIAAMYGEGRLVVLTLAIAPTLLVNGLAMPLQAAVQRELHFGKLARIDVTSMLCGVVLSIAAAAAGWGVWSLVIFAGAGQLYRLVALWRAARPRWGRPHISRDVTPLVTTGGSIFGVQVLNYAARNVDNVIIGHQLGPAALGQYSRAYALFLLPLQQLTGPLGRVALPVLSKLQDDAERYRRYVRGALLVIGYLSLPTYAIAAAASSPLFGLLLGPGWGEAAQIFALLAIAGVAQAVGNVQGWLYITLGRAHRQLAYYVVTRPIVIAMFFVGIAWDGMEGLALAYGLTTVALLVPGFYLAVRGTFVRMSDIVTPLVRPALLAPLCFAAAWIVHRASEGLGMVTELALTVAAGLAVLAASQLVPPFRRDVRLILDFAAQARKPVAQRTEQPDVADVRD